MIQTRVEGSRGCGVRKPGGLYLVSGQLSEPCPRLPLELDRCPHCGQGIGPSRSFTWVTPAFIVPAEKHGTVSHNTVCPIGNEEGTFAQHAGHAHVNLSNYGHRMGERAGLIWIGEKFYPTAEEFMAEAARMGVSRRITAVPHGFEVGETWVILGHRKAIRIPGPPDDQLGAFEQDELGPTFKPGVVTMFKPTAIEYVVKGDETDEEIAAIEERGIQPVKVINTDADAPVDTEES